MEERGKWKKGENGRKGKMEERGKWKKEERKREKGR
jgi:hypothetical protein